MRWLSATGLESRQGPEPAPAELSGRGEQTRVFYLQLSAFQQSCYSSWQVPESLTGLGICCGAPLAGLQWVISGRRSHTRLSSEME